MSPLSTIEITQIILIGTGILCVLIAPGIAPVRRLLDMWKAEPKIVPVRHVKTATIAATYRSLPTNIRPVLRVKAADLKRTARMTFQKACTSSQQILTNFHQNIVPRIVPSSENPIA